MFYGNDVWKLMLQRRRFEMDGETSMRAYSDHVWHSFWVGVKWILFGVI